MVNQKQKQKRTMRHRMWQSYLCVALLSLLCGVIIFFVSNRIIYNQTMEAYSGVLHAAGSMLDKKLVDIHGVINELVASSQVRMALATGWERPANRQAQTDKVLSDLLADYALNIDGLLCASIYRHADDKMIASECCTSAKNYYDMRYRTTMDLPLERWHDLMAGEYLTMTEQMLTNAGGDAVVWYLRSLPLTGSSPAAHPQATLALEVRADFFSGFYKDLGLEPDLTFEVFGKMGERVFSSHESPHAGGVTAIAMRSEETGWEYQLHVPNYLLSQTTNFLLWTSIAMVLLLAIVSSLLIRRFISQHYGPIDRMIHDISEKVGVNVNDEELAFIQKQFDSLYKEQHHTLERVETLKRSMKQVCLINLLLGNSTDANLQELGEIDFEFGTFLVAIVAGKGQSILDEGASEELSVQILGENGFMEGDSTWFNGCVVFLIDCTSMSAQDLEINTGILVDMLEETGCQLAISDRHVGTEGIAKAYREARFHIQYAALSENSLAPMYKDHFSLIRQNLDESARLANLIADRDADASSRAIRDIFQRNREACRHDPMLGYVFVSLLMGDIVKSCRHAFTEKEYEIMNAWEESLKSYDYNALETLLLTLAQALCERPGQEVSARTSLKREVLAYLDENFQDPNLGMDSIADHFGRSVATLTRAFKDEGGESTLTGEIARRRIQSACQMLATPDEKRTVGEISRQVGYSSIATFMRQFKRMTGISPGRYQEMGRAMRQEPEAGETHIQQG